MGAWPFPALSPTGLPFFRGRPVGSNESLRHGLRDLKQGGVGLPPPARFPTSRATSKTSIDQPFLFRPSALGEARGARLAIARTLQNRLIGRLSIFVIHDSDSPGSDRGGAATRPPRRGRAPPATPRPSARRGCPRRWPRDPAGPRAAPGRPHPDPARAAAPPSPPPSAAAPAAAGRPSAPPAGTPGPCRPAAPHRVRWPKRSPL